MERASDPLHGVTLENMLTQLVDSYGWEEMGRQVEIRCFTSDPSIASSLKFLRRTPWARKKVEAMYLRRERALARRRRRSAGPDDPSEAS